MFDYWINRLQNKPAVRASGPGNALLYWRTYSATSLDYTASLYYDSDTVATLFDNRSQIQQAVAEVNTNTSASLTAAANAWDDYDLQTDR